MKANNSGFTLSDVKIARSGKTDIPFLARLISELFAIETDFPVNTAKQEAGLAMLMENEERALVLKASYDDEIIGMVTVQLVVSTAMGGWSGLLEDMVVALPFRAKGVGSLLVGEAEKWSAEKGATRIQLLADKANPPALDFYRRRGYENTSMVARRKLLG
jgi:GNAT superfamily N-acetyltransferase